MKATKINLNLDGVHRVLSQWQSRRLFVRFEGWGSTEAFIASIYDLYYTEADDGEYDLLFYFATESGDHYKIGGRDTQLGHAEVDRGVLTFQFDDEPSTTMVVIDEDSVRLNVDPA